MKKVSVLLTKYSDRLSCLLFYLSGRGYTHISLALEENEDEFYSFNYFGFCTETVEKHRRRGVNKSMSYQIEVPEIAYKDIKQRIDEFQKQREMYHYSKVGLVCTILRIPFRRNQHYTCSQFVAELLHETGALSLRKPSSRYLPNQLCAELETCTGLRAKICNPI